MNRNIHHCAPNAVNSQIHPSNFKRNKGQALAEFVVVASFILVPTIIMMPYLAKMADSQHKANEATRYVTWEKTVWRDSGTKHNIKTNDEINNEITQRVFGLANNRLHSVEDKQDKLASEVQLDHFLYVSNHQDGGSIPILKIDDEGKYNSINSSRNSAPDTASAVLESVDDIGLVGIDSQGEHNSQVSIEFEVLPYAPFKQDLSKYLNNQPFVSTNKGTILAEAWNAKGPEDIVDTVSAAVPTDYLESAAVKKLGSISDAIGMSEFENFEPGKVDAERVPCRRLIESFDC